VHVIVAISTRNANATVAALQTDTVYTLLTPAGINATPGTIKATLGAPAAPAPAAAPTDNGSSDGGSTDGDSTDDSTTDDGAPAEGDTQGSAASTDDDSSGSSNIGAIVGGVVGGVLAAVALGAGVWVRLVEGGLPLAGGSLEPRVAAGGRQRFRVAWAHPPGPPPLNRL
jgi:cobalamin biosynthesis Mg chelatase CobN